MAATAHSAPPHVSSPSAPVRSRAGPIQEMQRGAPHMRARATHQAQSGLAVRAGAARIPPPLPPSCCPRSRRAPCRGAKRVRQKSVCYRSIASGLPELLVRLPNRASAALEAFPQPFTRKCPSPITSTHHCTKSAALWWPSASAGKKRSGTQQGVWKAGGRVGGQEGGGQPPKHAGHGGQAGRGHATSAAFRV